MISQKSSPRPRAREYKGHRTEGGCPPAPLSELSGVPPVPPSFRFKCIDLRCGAKRTCACLQIINSIFRHAKAPDHVHGSIDARVIIINIILYPISITRFETGKRASALEIVYQHEA